MPSFLFVQNSHRSSRSLWWGL